MTPQDFNFCWMPAAADTVAAFEALLGKQAFAIDGVYWRQVRPGFYRPLLQFKEYPATTVTPRRSLFGAAQHAVPAGTPANSHLNCILFTDTAGYTAAQLDQNRQRQIRLATREFVIQPVSDVQEFKQGAHAVYLSFLERTGYEYGSARRDPARFNEWADALFSMPEILVLGGYRQGNLVGISVSFLVDHTLCYASFFCTTPALKLYMSDLMLHAVRSAAARQATIKDIFAGLYKGNDGLDRFYFLRGAQCVRKPARLYINPLLKPVLRYGFPSLHGKLVGSGLAERTETGKS